MVLCDRVCQGGLGARSPPSLDLHWILKTRSFLGSDVALDRDITWFCGPGRVSGGRGDLFFVFCSHALIPKNVPEAAAANSAEAFLGWRNHPQRDMKRRGRTGRENDDDNGGPGQVSVGRGGLRGQSPPSLDLRWTVVLWDRVGRGSPPRGSLRSP